MKAVARSILDLLGLGGTGRRRPKGQAASTDSETVHRIAAALERLDRDRARHIAAFAFILSRAARADLHISDEETRAMTRSVVTWGRLPEEQAALVVEIAKHQNVLFGATDDFLVTREFARSATREQKVDLLHCLFAVSASDASISTAEEASIGQIAKELGLTHDELVDVRRKYRDRLAVLKNAPR